jgi:hypothetical protein
MAAVIELQVKADIQNAASGLKALVADLTKTGTISTSTAATVQSALNKMTGSLDGFGSKNFSDSFVSSSGQIVKASGLIGNAAVDLNKTLVNVATGINLSSLRGEFLKTGK